MVLVYLLGLRKNKTDVAVAGFDRVAAESVTMVQSIVQQLYKLISAAVEMHSFQSPELAELK